LAARLHKDAGSSVKAFFGEYEMCSSVYIRFLCACVASIGGFATALSGKTFTAI